MEFGKLSSAELGRKGEATFSKACADVGLICNKANIDETGWDFFVESKLPSRDNEISLDKRLPPLSCFVQVKSMYDNAPSFKLKLSTAEPLLKQPKPAFIYVLIYKRDKACSLKEVTLVHLAEEVLDTILRRLRLAEKNKENIKRIFVSFNKNKFGKSIGFNGQDFWNAVTEECGTDLNGYIKKKELELRTSGFNARPVTISTSFLTNDMDELVEGFLGLKPLRFFKATSIESRYDIKIPIFEDQEGVLTITPSKACDCEIELTGMSGTLKANFKGEIILPAVPSVPEENYRFLIKCNFFLFHIKAQSFTFELISDDFEKKGVSIGEWIDACKIIALCNSGEIEFSLKCPITSKITHTFETPPNTEAYEYWTRMGDLFQMLQQLLQVCGIFEPVIKIDELSNLEGEISLVSKIFNRTAISSDTLKFKTPYFFGNSSEVIDFLCISHLKFGPLHFAYYFIAKMKISCDDGMSTLASYSLEPGRAINLHSFPNDYESFVSSIQTALGVPGLFMKPANDTRAPFFIETADDMQL